MDADVSQFETPFFLVGCVRSGTTVLRLMLGHHSRVCNCDEMDYVTPALVGASGPVARLRTCGRAVFVSFVASSRRSGACRQISRSGWRHPSRNGRTSLPSPHWLQQLSTHFSTNQPPRHICPPTQYREQTPDQISQSLHFTERWGIDVRGNRVFRHI